MSTAASADLPHLARLARLELDPADLPHYAAQMEAILALFTALSAVDTSQMGEVLASFDDLALTPRPDVPVPCLPREAALGQSARREGDYIAVPRVLGGGEAAGE
jgi:aspartyl-tRNA(Asn)/glutamyl-tRNA(Gln) amidotransferase subunit C